jgi:hypothetical protein
MVLRIAPAHVPCVLLGRDGRQPYWSVFLSGMAVWLLLDVVRVLTAGGDLYVCQFQSYRDIHKTRNLLTIDMTFYRMKQDQGSDAQNTALHIPHLICSVMRLSTDETSSSTYQHIKRDDNKKVILSPTFRACGVGIYGDTLTETRITTLSV